jgi:hypothetical protein
MYYLYRLLAQTYDSGAYGSSTYGGATTVTSGGTGTGGASAGGATSGAGGVLSNTGFDIVLAITLACTLIFVALVIYFWRRPAATKR